MNLRFSYKLWNSISPSQRQLKKQQEKKNYKAINAQQQSHTKKTSETHFKYCNDKSQFYGRSKLSFALAQRKKLKHKKNRQQRYLIRSQWNYSLLEIV